MNFAFLAAALLAQSAQPAPAKGTAPAAAGQQQQSGPRPSPQLRAAVQEFGKCMETAVAAIPASATPEDGAKSASAACAAQLAKLNSAGETWIAGEKMTAAQKADMRARLATVGAGLEARTLERIRQLRATASARPPVEGR